MAPTLKRGMQQGITVLTWDADSAEESRHYFVNRATYEDIGSGLVDIMAEQIGGEGDVAIVTGSLTAANQNIWMEWMDKHLAAAAPGLNIVAVRPSEEDQQLAYQVAQDLLKAHPNIRGLWGITSVAFPGAAAAVRGGALGEPLGAGRLGDVRVHGDEVLLGAPMHFNRDNIEQFDF